MNGFYESAIGALLAGDLDLDDDPLAVALHSAEWWDPTDTTFADLTYLIPVTAQPLVNATVVGRTLVADDTTFPAVPEDQFIRALVLHRSDTGALVAHIDRRPDLAPIFVAANGGPVTLQWGGGSGVVISL